MRSDVGLYLNSGDGSYLKAEVRDSSFNVIATVTLRDDGVAPDDVASDGIFHGTFTLPSVLDEAGGTWTVIAWPGDPPDYDNGYHVSDSLQFLVEGLDATPEDISVTVVEGTPVQVTIHVTNVGVQDAQHVKLMVDPAGQVDPSYVSFSSNDFVLAAGDSTDVVMTIDVPPGDPTGTFSMIIYVFDDEDLNDLPDDCRVDALSMTLTIEPPLLYVTADPASISSTVQPKCDQSITKYYYVVSFHNSGALDDVYDISVRSDPDWNISVYLDVNGDDDLGLSDFEPANFADDVLIAYDLDGDSANGWTYVNDALDTYSDGIPDTGDLTPHGGLARMVFLIDVPRRTPPGTYQVVIRGSSNLDWQTNYPADPYYADEIFHDETVLSLT
ncbi:MAG: hypothetical protein QI199_08395, partial [Candidatus Korarchaeota archaeon]|nr:hypothetical protein [Candidatus Korarchaeota archaeon]